MLNSEQKRIAKLAGRFSHLIASCLRKQQDDRDYWERVYR